MWKCTVKLLGILNKKYVYIYLLQKLKYTEMSVNYLKVEIGVSRSECLLEDILEPRLPIIHWLQ